MSSAWRRGFVYLGFLVLLAASTVPCRQAAWHGTAQLHTLLEAISTTLGFLAGAMALIRYYAKKTPAYLLLGGGLVGASLLDGYHAVITSSFLFGIANSAPAALAAWSGVTPRVFLGLLLFFSSVASRDWTAHSLFHRIGERSVYTVMGISTVASFLIFTLLPLPPVMRPAAFLCRPSELVPSALFALTALHHLRKGAWKDHAFEHWLVLSLVAATAGHLFYMAFSSHLYDARYIVAHLLKLFSLILLTTGLVGSISPVFRSEADAVVRLLRTNVWLAQEIAQRVRAEEEVRRSHVELEARVRERTANLAEQRGQLAAAHMEIDLVLTSIPSILIGLDHDGRIIRWNRRASETFGIASGDAIGQTLDACGIQWRSLDMRMEVSRWLGSQTPLRSDDLGYEKDGEERFVGFTVLQVTSPKSDAPGLLITGADVTGRRNVEAALAYFGAIVESVDAAIIGADLDGKIRTWNAAAERMYGYSLEEVKGRPMAILWPSDVAEEWSGALCSLNRGEAIEHVESMRVRKDGERIPVLISYSPIRDGSGKIVSTCSIGVDITERKLLERQLAQAQKLESIGQLAAGIAHEINTPIQDVGDNIRFLRDSFAQIEQLFQGYDRLLESVRSQSPEAPFLADIEALAKAVRVSYLRAEIPKSIEDSLDGAGRVAEIVRAIKEFSHPGLAEKTPLDINRAIESTVLVSRNEWKYVADLQAELDANLPPVMCVPGEFNQVILNLIVNAAHAIADVVSGKPGTKGTIIVSTERDGDWAEVRVKDTGTGIPEDVQSSVFNPFFTTKGVGKGTGQGLSIAHTVIVQKHGGTISFDTATGVGTTFKIRIPISGSIEKPAGEQQMQHDPNPYIAPN
jgi:PAS domain S-box-containing protein